MVNGAPRMVSVGDLIEETDPVLRGREELFEDAELFVSDKAAAVEAATASPGEKRVRSQPAGSQTKPAAKPAGKPAATKPATSSKADQQKGTGT